VPVPSASWATVSSRYAGEPARPTTSSSWGVQDCRGKSFAWAITALRTAVACDDPVFGGGTWSDNASARAAFQPLVQVAEERYPTRAQQRPEPMTSEAVARWVPGALLSVTVAGMRGILPGSSLTWSSNGHNRPHAQLCPFRGLNWATIDRVRSVALHDLSRTHNHPFGGSMPLAQASIPLPKEHPGLAPRRILESKLVGAVNYRPSEGLEREVERNHRR